MRNTTLDSALARYQEAAATTEEQLRRDPDNPQRIFDHAQSVYWVGYIAWQRGDADAAKEYLTRYYDYAHRLVEIDPEKDEWQIELLYAYSNLGTLALDQGEATEAESRFRKSLEVAKLLYKKHSGQTEQIIALGQGYAWLADTYYFQAKLDEADSARSAEIQLYAQATSSVKANAGIDSAKLVALYTRAQIALSSNLLDDALRDALDATHLANSLTRLDPGNLEIANMEAFAKVILGETQLYLQRYTESRSTLGKALDIVGRLRLKDASVVKWKGNSGAQAILVLAHLDAAEHNTAAALGHLDKLEAELSEFLKAKTASQVMVRRYADVLASRARISTNFPQAWAKIVALLAPQQSRQGPEGLVLLAEALERTDKHADASSIASNLYAAGYRHPDFLALLAAHPDLNQEHSAAVATNRR